MNILKKNYRNAVDVITRYLGTLGVFERELPEVNTSGFTLRTVCLEDAHVSAINKLLRVYNYQIEAFDLVTGCYVLLSPSVSI